MSALVASTRVSDHVLNRSRSSGGDPQQLGDDDHRQRVRDRVDDVQFPVGVRERCLALEQLVGNPANAGLEVAKGPRLERVVDDATELVVPRRILKEHRLEDERLFGSLRFDVVVGPSQVDRERLVVGEDSLDVVVSKDVPAAPFRIVPDRGLRAHLAVPAERLEPRRVRLEFLGKRL